MSSGPIDVHEPSWSELLVESLLLGIVTIGGSSTQTMRMYQRLVERRRWLAHDEFARAIKFCRMLPGPETLQIAIHLGRLKRKLLGGVLAGIVFILPGLLAMLLLTRLYLNYVHLPRVTALLFIVKPAVLGIITAGAIKLAAASIRNFFFAAIMLASCAALTFSKTSLLLVLLAAGLLNLVVSGGLLRLQARLSSVSAILLIFYFLHPHWLRLMWLSFKTGAFSFGGSYAVLVFLQQGAVENYRWVPATQLIDGVALTLATPGPFILLATFVGYLAGGIKGGLLATVFVLLPSFVLLTLASRLNETRSLRAFLDGFSAALTGAIVIVVMQLAPGVILQPFTVIIALLSFLSIVLLRVDIAIVAAVAIVGGIVYGFFPVSI
jgi:chromate transporter